MISTQSCININICFISPNFIIYFVLLFLSSVVSHFAFITYLCDSFTIVILLCASFISSFFLLSIWLFSVFRALPSALCQVVTVRVCRSPHVVCRAVRTLPGNSSLMMCVVVLVIFVTFSCPHSKNVSSLYAVLCSHSANRFRCQSLLLQVTALICLLT